MLCKAFTGEVSEGFFGTTAQGEGDGDGRLECAAACIGVGGTLVHAARGGLGAGRGARAVRTLLSISKRRVRSSADTWHKSLVAGQGAGQLCERSGVAALPQRCQEGCAAKAAPKKHG